jgi:hypothetical protein
MKLPFQAQVPAHFDLMLLRALFLRNHSPIR